MAVRLRWIGITYLAVSVPLAVWLLPTGREQPPVEFAAPHHAPVWGPATMPIADARRLAIRQARVWQQPDPSTELASNPRDPAGTLSEPIVRCRYLPGPAHGTTAKFDCVLRDGEVVKVKYGHTGEIHAEVAATRLLTALGFGADRMYLIPRLRCYGCVRTPFYTMWALDYVHARDVLTRSIPGDSFSDFEWVAVERRFPGSEIKNGNTNGWAWYELDAIDAARGANRAERDALRLAAVLLAHWDNKAANQRLVCGDDEQRPEESLPEGGRHVQESPPEGGHYERNGACKRPFAYVDDLGSTFGPNKLDFDRWKNAPIWKDARACAVSMKSFPYDGGTFQDVRISEAGRQLIARELKALDEPRLAALFASARFPQFLGSNPSADAHAWAAAFLDKVRQIEAAGPCE